VYLTFDTAAVMKEIGNPGSLNKVVDGDTQATTSTVLEYYEEGGEEEGRFARTVANADGDAAHRLALMCIHAMAHLNGIVSTNFSHHRGCEHDTIFRRELARLFPMTFTKYGDVPPFAADIMKFVV
jgi:hypothetical protein